MKCHRLVEISCFLNIIGSFSRKTGFKVHKLTVKWIPKLLQHPEFLHKGSTPFSVGSQYLSSMVKKQLRLQSLI